MIVALQEDLAKKNVRIQELDEMVSSLNEDVEESGYYRSRSIREIERSR